jgi:peroxiredoxin Q/BCP
MMRFAQRVAFALAVASVGCAGPQQRPDGGKGLLPVGAAAPDVQGQTLDEHTVRLSDQRGCAAVVYFYPRDGTPGCTKEACAFRDSWDRFHHAGVAIFGVSSQSRG